MNDFVCHVFKTLELHCYPIRKGKKDQVFCVKAGELTAKAICLLHAA